MTLGYSSNGFVYVILLPRIRCKPLELYLVGFLFLSFVWLVQMNNRTAVITYFNTQNNEVCLCNISYIYDWYKKQTFKLILIPEVAWMPEATLSRFKIQWFTCALVDNMTQGEWHRSPYGLASTGKWILYIPGNRRVVLLLFLWLHHHWQYISIFSRYIHPYIHRINNAA